MPLSKSNTARNAQSRNLTFVHQYWLDSWSIIGHLDIHCSTIEKFKIHFLPIEHLDTQLHDRLGKTIEYAPSSHPKRQGGHQVFGNSSKISRSVSQFD